MKRAYTLTSFLGLVLLASSIATTTGCRHRGGPDGNDELDPFDVIEGDYPLVPLADAELGQRVTDVQFETVLFAYDSAQIARSERRKLEVVATYLRRTTARTRVVLEGHCDERGSREYNMALGERRALAARAFLIHLGIDSARIVTRSYGEERPAQTGHSESTWRLNRRVEPVAYRR